MVELGKRFASSHAIVLKRLLIYIGLLEALQSTQKAIWVSLARADKGGEREELRVKGFCASKATFLVWRA